MKQIELTQPYDKLRAVLEPEFKELFPSILRHLTSVIYDMSKVTGMGIHQYRPGPCPKLTLDRIEKEWGTNDLGFPHQGRPGEYFCLDYVHGRCCKFAIRFGDEITVTLADHANPVEVLTEIFKRVGVTC